MARSEDKIKDGAAQFLEPGEEIQAAIVARPRGWTQASASPGGGALAGAIGGAIGGKKQQENVEAAQQAGFNLPNPVGLAVTQSRLLALDVSAGMGMGIGLKVKALADSAPLSDVDSIESKRLAAGKTVTVTLRGAPFTLEVGAGANVDGVVEAVQRAGGAGVQPAG
jgi:hypothetical protein